MIFYEGELWKPEWLITDPKTDGKVEPATLTATVRRPDQSTESPAVTRIQTTLSEDTTLPATTINVASAAELPPEGTVLIGTSEIAYKAKTATSLLQCSGGTGTALKGAAVKGNYTTSISLTAAGQWHVKLVGTGTYQCAGPETITVETD